ncbi:hypothetical protein B0T17DRAFT_512476 [Bombardia bombarda]|uniref:Uncharacterized protein n=1 Tax=Bombardia bombarda TaxID=252184 RepID=A0AA39WCH4_9PEZI|nr:hypothetical protein B0T17DRAFT_512476 [Bombardia bombarda]
MADGDGPQGREQQQQQGDEQPGFNYYGSQAMNAQAPAPAGNGPSWDATAVNGPEPTPNDYNDSALLIFHPSHIPAGENFGVEFPPELFSHAIPVVSHGGQEGQAPQHGYQYPILSFISNSLHIYQPPVQDVPPSNTPVRPAKRQLTESPSAPMKRQHTTSSQQHCPQHGQQQQAPIPAPSPSLTAGERSQLSRLQQRSLSGRDTVASPVEAVMKKRDDNVARNLKLKDYRTPDISAGNNTSAQGQMGSSSMDVQPQQTMGFQQGGLPQPAAPWSMAIPTMAFTQGAAPPAFPTVPGRYPVSASPDPGYSALTQSPQFWDFTLNTQSSPQAYAYGSTPFPSQTPNAQLYQNTPNTGQNIPQSPVPPQPPRAASGGAQGRGRGRGGRKASGKSDAGAQAKTQSQAQKKTQTQAQKQTKKATQTKNQGQTQADVNTTPFPIPQASIPSPVVGAYGPNDFNAGSQQQAVFDPQWQQEVSQTQHQQPNQQPTSTMMFAQLPQGLNQQQQRIQAVWQQWLQQMLPRERQRWQQMSPEWQQQYQQEWTRRRLLQQSAVPQLDISQPQLQHEYPAPPAEAQQHDQADK